MPRQADESEKWPPVDVDVDRNNWNSASETKESQGSNMFRDTQSSDLPAFSTHPESTAPMTTEGETGSADR